MTDLFSEGGIAPTWRVRCHAPTAMAEAIEEALRSVCGSAATFAGADDERWTVEAYSAVPVDEAVVEDAIQRVARSMNAAVPAFEIMDLGVVDWVARNRATFRPVRWGRFFIYPTHHDETMPAGTIPIRLDAGTAFGSGHHATTGGCLLAIEALGKRGFDGPLLDLGCGSGILAIAMAKLWHRPVLATDVDRKAVGVARTNVEANGVAGLVTARRADGVSADVRRAGPFGLIVANILARPLCAMADDIRTILHPGGRVVLSGLLARDAPQVSATFRMAGLRLRSRRTLDDWTTLIMARPGNAAHRDPR